MTAVNRLVQITDLHLCTPPGDIMLSGVNTDESLQRVLNAASDDIQRSEMVIASGDLVQQPTRDAYQRIVEKLEPYGCQFRFIAGNHDDPSMMNQYLSGVNRSVGGDAGFGDWRLVFLDTSAENRVDGELSAAELQRLDALLSRCGERHVLIFLHHHPLPINSAWMDRIGLSNSAAFLDVIDRYAAVRAVAFGHIHQEFDTVRGGVRFLGTPSTCIQFKPGSELTEIDELPPAWRWFELFDDGTFSTAVSYLDY